MGVHVPDVPVTRIRGISQRPLIPGATLDYPFSEFAWLIPQVKGLWIGTSNNARRADMGHASVSAEQARDRSRVAGQRLASSLSRRIKAGSPSYIAKLASTVRDNCRSAVQAGADRVLVEPDHGKSDQANTIELRIPLIDHFNSCPKDIRWRVSLTRNPPVFGALHVGDEQGLRLIPRAFREETCSHKAMKGVVCEIHPVVGQDDAAPRHSATTFADFGTARRKPAHASIMRRRFSIMSLRR